MKIEKAEIRELFDELDLTLAQCIDKLRGRGIDKDILRDVEYILNEVRVFADNHDNFYDANESF